MSILRTPAGAGIALLIVGCLCALVWSENPCERADGGIKAECIAVKPHERGDGK